MSKVYFPPSSLTYRELVEKNPEELSKELEAIFIKEILKVAFESMLSEKSFTTRMYYDAFLEGVSEKLASAGGVGIAKFVLSNIAK
ncbi:hypothetical protein JCM9492_05110 [Aquifex pyrophilus]